MSASKLKEIEKEVQHYWTKHQIPQKALNMRGKRGKFYFLDGPPYVTNPIHIGTAWNKIIKDVVLRIKRMQGYTVWCRPGFDTHGLPIEVMVEKRLNVTRKKQIIEEIGLRKFNEECIKIVNKNLTVLKRQFSSLGVWMDWSNPYITFTEDYISSVWWGIKRIYQSGLLSKERRIFHWCPRCETVLSEHEVAQGYKEVKSPSIYVKFPIIGRQNEYILVWTTTPWTLPSNVAVMVHPKLKYVRVKLKKTKEIFILLKERLNEVIEEEYEILEEFPGKILEGIRYTPPLINEVPAQRNLKRGYRVVLNEKYVSEREGTGCVHMAPEHGKEDFEVAVENNLPHLILVDDEGKFVKNAGKYYGKYIFDANNEIISDLMVNKLLYKKETITHKYPHCWRCKTPLFLRSTEQWVIKLSKMRNKMLKENEKIEWIPEWAGRQRFADWIKEARDWVISRQRFWGTPLPIWICNRCGKIEVVGSKKELEDRSGKKIENTHIPFIDTVSWSCDCGGRFTRVPDVLDVWIDSGAASWASLNYPDNKGLFERLWPVDFITEGHDQTRGWFYALLALGLVIFGQAPYRTVLMHGFTLDSKGRPMHKSLGNVIYPEEITRKYGVDSLRTFLLKNTIWRDLPVSFNELDNTKRELEIVLNVYQFYSMYAELDRFIYDEEKLLRNYRELFEEDRWILSEFETTIDEISKEIKKYHLHEYVKKILRFAVDEISRRYLKMIRRRVWIEAMDWSKEAAYLTLHYILKKLAILMAPFAPFVSDYLYLRCLGKFDKKCLESVHLEKWPEKNEKLINKRLEEKYEIFWKILSAFISLRQQAGIKIRQPLKKGGISKDIYERLSSRQRELLRKLVNVVKLIPVDKKEMITYVLHPKKEALRLKWKEKSEKILNEIKKEKSEIARQILEKGEAILTINGEEIRISTEELVVEERIKKMYLSEVVDAGRVFLNIKIDAELKLLGILNDIIRRVQMMRKDINLDVAEYIELAIEASSDVVYKAIENRKKYFMEEVRAIKVQYSLEGRYDYLKEWSVNDLNIKIGISRLKK